jgi:hypothetical protein
MSLVSGEAGMAILARCAGMAVCVVALGLTLAFAVPRAAAGAMPGPEAAAGSTSAVGAGGAADAAAGAAADPRKDEQGGAGAAGSMATAPPPAAGQTDPTAPPAAPVSGQAAPVSGQAAPAAPAKAGPDSYLAAQDQAARDPVGTRLIDIATPFTSGTRWLELLVTHRFIQPFNQGGTGHNLWGLDSGADVGIGFTYGVFQHLDVSVYRSEFQEDYELAAKYQFLQQGPGMPLSLAVRAGADLLGRAGIEDPHRPFVQLLLGRRLAPGWNLFVSPSWVQYTPLLHNAWNTPIGITAPLPGHWLVEAEGIPANRALRDTPGASEFAWHVAFTKPIGWHVFQILVGNSRATTVDQILGGDFAGGFTTHDLRLGFNLIRYFNT